MTTNSLYPLLQSAYRKYHSTETALLKVKNDLLMNMNKGHVSILVLLDMSSAFDTVDHEILIQRLETKFGFKGTVLAWFSSYLNGRQQRVLVNDSLSDIFELNCGVPQGSCLGPLLFTLYIIDRHLPDIHAYADDSQLYISFNPNSVNDQEAAILAIQQCIDELHLWMTRDKLMFNDGKTEIVLVGTSQQLKKVGINTMKICNTEITPVDVVRDLGVWLDSRLRMDTHVTKIRSAAFYHLYNIRRIRKFLSKSHTETLIHAFVTCRLDYCNSLLYGLPDTLISKLQRVQNACVRLVYHAPKQCHITPLLQDLHWLPVKMRIMFKILLLTFKALHQLAPSYLSELITIITPGRYNLRMSNNGLLLSYPRGKSKKTLGDRSFMVAAPTLWNSLPAKIRDIEQLIDFKSNLKTYLFKKAFIENR